VAAAAPVDRIWTPVELVRWTAGYLGEKGVPEPRLTAELLLAGVLGIRRLDLYLQFERPLSAEELAEFKARLLRRVRREPLQYIEGTASFRYLTLRTDRRALIPRPETELLVGEVLAWSAGREGLDVVDVGTGTGAIALSLRREGTFGRTVATDLSTDALALARENAELSQLRDIEFLQGDLFEPVRGERFDVIVANPPYVAEGERGELDPEVRQWEPPTALFAGRDGLDVIRRLISGAPEHLKPGGLLALEIGASQAAAVVDLIEGSGRFEGCRVVRDLAGRERMVLAMLGGRSNEHE
jgi:release factor glutamine methyltransferase